jgi:hypothetical protein
VSKVAILPHFEAEFRGEISLTVWGKRSGNSEAKGDRGIKTLTFSRISEVNSLIETKIRSLERFFQCPLRTKTKKLALTLGFFLNNIPSVTESKSGNGAPYQKSLYEGMTRMWNISCASICASNGQYLESSYGRHVSLSNKMKFIKKVSLHRRKWQKRSEGKQTRTRMMNHATGHQGAAQCH